MDWVFLQSSTCSLEHTLRCTRCALHKKLSSVQRKQHQGVVRWARCAGEYIAPERIEGALKKASAVQQVYIHGNSFESSLVAVVVPTEAELRSGFHVLSLS